MDDPDNIDKSVASTIGYNTSGSMIFGRGPLNRETRVSYADSFSDGQNNRNTSGGRAEAVSAAVDTGSTLCVFQREITERLGIRLEEGIEDHVSAMGTIIKVYGHEVTLVIEELSVDLIVYFPAYQQIPRNLIGRQGFLQRMLFGLDDI